MTKITLAACERWTVRALGGRQEDQLSRWEIIGNQTRSMVVTMERRRWIGKNIKFTGLFG